MTTPVATFAPHNRINIEGTFPANGGVAAEIFSFGLCDDSGLSPQALCEAVQAPIDTWFHDPANNIVSFITLSQIRVEAIQANGKVASSYAVTDTTAGGLVQTNSLPFICCASITLETADLNPHGRPIRGRFYPPNTGWAASSNGFGTGMGLNIAQSGARLVSALNAAGAKIVVASQTGGGKNAVVTACSADNVVDTQRRRKNHAKGTRGTQSLPYP